MRYGAPQVQFIGLEPELLLFVPLDRFGYISSSLALVSWETCRWRVDDPRGVRLLALGLLAAPLSR